MKRGSCKSVRGPQRARNCSKGRVDAPTSSCLLLPPPPASSHQFYGWFMYDGFMVVHRPFMPSSRTLCWFMISPKACSKVSGKWHFQVPPGDAIYQKPTIQKHVINKDELIHLKYVVFNFLLVASGCPHSVLLTSNSESTQNLRPGTGFWAQDSEISARRYQNRCCNRLLLR